MPAISFYQNVVITDKKKIDEIKHAIESGEKAYQDVPPAKIDFDEQRKNAAKLCSIYGVEMVSIVE